MTLKIIRFVSVILLFHYSSHHVNGFSREDPVVVTKVGSFRGLRASNGNYTMFLGIPFARVNDTFPFGDTLPVPSFDGVFEAYDDNVRCPQWFNGSITGSLDCLHVNIHVPDSAAPDNPLPVMIYIFGGRFVIGTAGRYLSGPEYLVRHDVIFASIGYRLGPYGFMCLDIPEVPGNHGLRDQEKGINWIKDNIESFGGDVNRMTLFGNSAGGMSVGLHLLSESEKVYRNAILQSGSSMLPDLFSHKDTSIPFKLAAKLGLVTDDIYEALNFLASVPPHDVLAVDDTDPAYSPCIEKSFPEIKPFIADHPSHLKHDHIKGMTILQGIASKEMLPSITEASYVDNFFEYELTNKQQFLFEGEALVEAATMLRRFYIGDENIDEKAFWELVHFLSDFNMAFPAAKVIPEYFEGGVEHVYQYLLTYVGARNYGKISQNVQHLPGATHADCLGYLFSLQFPGVPAPSGEDQVMLDRMTTMWTNFAKYNDPTPEVTELLPVKWEPVTQGSPEYYLEINSTLSLGQAYQHQRINFWKLFYKVYGEYQFGYNSSLYADDSASAIFVSPVLVLCIIVHFIYI